MNIFDKLRRWWCVYRVTNALFATLDPICQPLKSSGVLEKARSDEFAIAYLYGVMARYFDAYGTVGVIQSAQILWKCYERVFPGHGKEIVELTVVRIKGKNEPFLRDVRLGMKETSAYLASKGRSGFPGVTARFITDANGHDPR